MAQILICAPDPLADDLHATAIWRDGNERHVATTFQEAFVMAVAVRPDLIVLDRDLPRAGRLVEDLRKDDTTRNVSIVREAQQDCYGVRFYGLEGDAAERVKAFVARDAGGRD